MGRRAPPDALPHGRRPALQRHRLGRAGEPHLPHRRQPSPRWWNGRRQRRAADLAPRLVRRCVRRRPLVPGERQPGPAGVRSDELPQPVLLVRVGPRAGDDAPGHRPARRRHRHDARRSAEARHADRDQGEPRLRLGQPDVASGPLAPERRHHRSGPLARGERRDRPHAALLRLPRDVPGWLSTELHDTRLQSHFGTVRGHGQHRTRRRPDHLHPQCGDGGLSRRGAPDQPRGPRPAVPERHGLHPLAPAWHRRRGVLRCGGRGRLHPGAGRVRRPPLPDRRLARGWQLHVRRRLRPPALPEARRGLRDRAD